jgi:hypothetical protein
MTRAVFAALAITVCCVHPACAEQKDKQPTLLQRLQGTWVRPNFDSVWVIKGKDCTEINKKRPLNAHAKGTLELPRDKDYAEVILDNGWTVWFFNAGKDNVAAEVFRPTGELHGHGYLLYRQPEAE